ncbi:MAG TPA: restriction endonuclease subunit S [Moheibacter sp.]|nr:restriction endonuclease subunit S [Moheibacter sp.]
MTKTTQYKNTSIGPIPTDWEVKKLGEVTLGKGTYGINASAVIYSEELPKYLRITDIDDEGYFSTEKLSSVDDPTSNEFFLNENDIVFVRTGSTTGKSYLYDSKDGQLVYAGFLIKFSINPSKANKYFIWSYTKSDKYNDWVSTFSQRSGQPGLNSNEFASLQIPLPPLPEQQKIAEVLSTWDKAIQETDAIIKKLEARNKALAFSLLTGKKRVKGFEDKEFKKSLANEVFKSVSIKNNPEDSVLLSATQEFGMIPRDMIETRVTMPSGSLKTYKLVEKGDFVISLRSFQGGIEYSEYTGLVSPAYTVLKSINPINDDFYKYYFKSEDLIGRLSVAVIGIRDGKNISYDDFSTIVLPNPSLEEQNVIAEILNTANQEVKQYQQKLEALKLQKKGLMQQLLTGKVRTV